MQISEWIRKSKRRTKTFFNTIKEKVASWLIPTSYYEKEVNDLFDAREAVQKLYTTLKTGKTAESQYALKELHHLADKQSKRPLNVYSAKVLSFVYNKGLSHGNFVVLPDKTKSARYREQSFSRLQIFEARLNTITKRLSSAFSNKVRKFKLIKRIADNGNKLACHQYAVYLQSQKDPSKKEVEQYFRFAASKSKENFLNTKKQGNVDTQNYMIKIHQRDEGINSVYPQIRLDALLDQGSSNKALFTSLNEEIKNNDPIALVHMGLYYLKRDSFSLEKAEDFHKHCLVQGDLSYTEQTWLEKLSSKLARYYEALFLEKQGWQSFELKSDAIEFLNRTIFYLQQIPKSSKNYQVAQFKIANFQKYFLKNDSATYGTFLKLAEQGDSDSVNIIVQMDFEKYLREEYSKELTDDEKQMLPKINESSGSIFTEIKHRSHLQEKNTSASDGVAVLKRIMNHLEEIEFPSEVINNFKQTIEKYEQEISQVTHSKPPARRVYDSPFLDPELKQKLKSCYKNFWETYVKITPVTRFFPPEHKLHRLEKNKYILQAYLEFIFVLNAHSKNSSETEDVKILKRASYAFLIEKCNTFFSNQAQKDISSDLPFGGSTHYAK